MIDKRSLILESIIKEYLKNPEPIGSEQLKISLDIKISSATIRNYLKRLVDDGELAQQHISSGRIPTEVALTNYWSNRLNHLDTIFFYDLATMSRRAKEIDIFFIAKIQDSNKLLKITKSENFLIMHFESSQLLIEYSQKLDKFLQSLISYEIEDIKKIVLKVGLKQLARRINSILEESFYFANSKAMMKLATDSLATEEYVLDTIRGKNFDLIADGVYFDSLVPTGYMAIKSDVFIEGKEAKLFCVGELSKNFDYFFSL
jgi:heat-inducible transcriptional repressor